jgi:hypothetical protein
MLVKKGDSGEEVKFWQYGPATMSTTSQVCTVDGDYGAATENGCQRLARKARGHRPQPGDLRLARVACCCADMAADKRRRNRQDRTGRSRWTAGSARACRPKGDPGQGGQFAGTLNVLGGQLSVEASA